MHIFVDLGLAFMRAVLTYLSKEARGETPIGRVPLCSLAGINSHFLSGNSIGSSVWVGALAVEQSCPTLWGQKASKRPRVQPEQLNDRPLTLRALPVLTMEFTSCVRYKALVSTSKSIHFDLATKSRKKRSSFILSFLTYFTHNEYTVRLGRKIDS